MFCLLLLFHCAASLNVLVYAPTMGYSHVEFMGNIADVLAEDGHNVTMLLVEYDPEVTGNGTTKSSRVIRYVAKRADPGAWRLLAWRSQEVFTLNSVKMTDIFMVSNYQVNICRSMLEDTEFLYMLKSSNFDIAVVEVMDWCPFGIFHLAGIPKLAMASALGFTAVHYMALDMPIWLSHTPSLGASFGSNLNLLQRIENFCIDFFTKTTVDYVLLNSNEFTETTRTMLPSIRHVGGSTIYQPSSLSKEFEKIYGKAKIGVVIFSMGSIVKQPFAPLWFTNVFREAFKEFSDYQFIWKIDSSDYSEENIHFRQWIPQISLLADNRTKAFVSHAGPNSIIESTHFGVPMVLIPMFWDQNWHASAAEEKGYAIKLDKFTLTKEILVSAMEAVLCPSGNSSCSSYYNAAKLASKIVKGAPEEMREDIMRVVRLSGENKQQLSHLRILSQLSLLQYYNFDVYAVIAIFVITVLVLFKRFTLLLMHKVRNTGEKFTKIE